MKHLYLVGVLLLFVIGVSAIGLASHQTPTLTMSRAAPGMVASPNPVDEGVTFTITGTGLARRHAYTLVFSLADGTLLGDPVAVQTNRGGNFTWSGSTDLFTFDFGGADWEFDASLIDGDYVTATTD